MNAKSGTGERGDPRVPSDPRLILFAAGDFAFNLFWQSTMLFLLFYYTDALTLPIGVAGTIFLVASVWDGLANFVTGLMVDRKAGTMSYRALLMVGALPLSLTFVLAYLPPAASGWVGITSVLACHLLFRTAYAAVNVPYLAMSARISGDGHQRAFVAGMRMLFGTLALVVVAVGTVPMGHWLTGRRDPVEAYLGAAMVFAIVAAAILLVVGSTYRDSAAMPACEPVAVRAALISLGRNRAFITLNLAMMAMIVAITILNKSVLYYFKYLLNDPDAGQLALASMGLVSAITVPLWMLSERWFGLRSLWLVASGVAIVGLTIFAAFDIDRSGVMQLFLMGMQAMIVGLNFIFWAMLPNTIEYGERTTGLHVEGAVFGVAAFLQRIAIGVAVAILGWSFDSAGYVANVTQSTATMTGMRLTVALVPLLFFALSCAAMVMNPLGRKDRGRRPG
ncbi:MAG: glycoside-pentoside-hexuronide (GPH):cation symporter [Sphingomicrobium sp.]